MRRTALLLLVTASVLWGLDKDQAFKVEAAQSYPNRTTQEKVTIAAVPYTTQVQMEAAFGKARPYDYGILPVLVVIQNDTGKALRVDLNAQFVTGDGEHVEATPPEDVQRFQAIQRNPGPRAPTGLPFPLPRGKQGPLNEEEITGRAWAVKLIPPGESAHGFVYYQAENLRDAQLYIRGLSEAATGQELFFFEVPLDKR